MLHHQLSRRPILSILVGLLLLVPTALSVSAQTDEVAGAAVDAPSLSEPLITHVEGGWAIDTGGPGTYFDAEDED